MNYLKNTGKHRSKKILLFFSLLTLLLSSYVYSQENTNPVEPQLVNSPQKTLFERQGFGIQIWNREWIKKPGEVGYEEFIDSINALTKTHSNYVHIYFNVRLWTSNGTEFDRFDRSFVPSDEQVEYLIDLLNERGFEINLKVGFYYSDPKFAMMYYFPNNVDSWFQNWTEILVHYAELAERKHVRTFDIAYEMCRLTGSYPKKWAGLIESVRQVYHGEISVNFQNPGEGRKAVFLKQLDVVQTSVFYRHTSKVNPTVDELVKSWNRNADGINIVKDLKALYEASGRKPFIIGDIAFISMPGANSNWNSNSGLEDRVDFQEQQNQYEAFFRVFSVQGKGWLTGVTFLTWFPFNTQTSKYRTWSWEIGDKGRSIKGKPAEETITQWFGCEVN